MKNRLVSTNLWLWATACLFWYSVHRERIGEPDGFDDLFAGPGGNIAGPIDLFAPFVFGFGIALLVRTIFRKLSGKRPPEKQSSAAPPPPAIAMQEDPSNPVDDDSEVIRLKAKLAEVEAATKKTEVQQRISQLEQELKEAEVKLNELKNDDQGS